MNFFIFSSEVNGVNDDTLVNPTAEGMNKLNRELKNFINTSTIAERAKVKAKMNNGEEQNKGEYL